MRQMFSVLILGTVLAGGTVAAHANGFADLGLPPLDPMRGVAVVAQADEPDVQPAPYPSKVVQPDPNQEHYDRNP